MTTPCMEFAALQWIVIQARSRLLLDGRTPYLVQLGPDAMAAIEAWLDTTAGSHVAMSTTDCLKGTVPTFCGLPWTPMPCAGVALHYK